MLGKMEWSEIEKKESTDSTSVQQPPFVGLAFEGESHTATQLKKKTKRRTAACWTSNWFKLVDPKDCSDGKPRAQCTKCGQLFMADSSKNGTSSLNSHMKRCPKRDNKDIRQMFMQSSSGKLTSRNLKIDLNVVHEMVLNLVIKNELPLKFVEYEGFRKLMLYLNPDYIPISRNILLSDIQNIFKKEKNTIREAIKSSAGRVSVTIDLWTSISNDKYMTLTAHFIDRSWVLHKKLIKFTVLIPPHSDADICDTVGKILTEWGLEGRLFSVTVDDASGNDVFVSYLRTNLNANDALVCKGEFFHVCCCAHVLNLIVQDAIKLIDKSIHKVRDSVKFVKSTQARKLRFEESCENMGMTTKRGLHGDVTTMWNSTYQMLDDALFYRQVFKNLENLDMNYKNCPTPDEWAKIGKIKQFLRPFNDITKVLSGSKYPTSNLYFPNLVLVHKTLNDGSLFGDDFMMEMVCAVREKFNKYWEKYSLVLSIVAVLDPRYKLRILEWANEKIHGGDSLLIDKTIDCVKSALGRLYGEYKSMPKEHESLTSDVEDDMDPFFIWAKKRKASASDKSELDQYLEEPVKPCVKEYDVMAYWKSCEAQFPYLSRLARDILAVPMSTIASESAFSSGGRVIDKYRNKLLPRNVEALVCLRDWMYDANFGVETDPDPDEDVEELSEALRDVISVPLAPPQASTTTVVI
ncbi:hypothetical protein NE237_004384 [Protea cynaroides]|uniref:Transposase n=1 Tax=Protea cynaroides TaxID=273540 RepID=A0A9Q0KIW1_9MAGN|nr:hypothetical protein NE237_004384 [Protea cynaroides]